MPRPPTISRQSVAQAALDIIDDEGPDALSIERIASALGVKGPSLYHHFVDKADIQAEVARLVFREVSVDHPDDDWETWMVEVSRSFYNAVLRHPNAVAVLMQHMPDSVAFPGFGKAATVLTRAGIDPSLHLILMDGLEKLTWGWALRSAMGPRRDQRQAWRKAVQKWPALAAAVTASPWRGDEFLETSLRGYLRGVLAMSTEDSREVSGGRPNGPR